MKKKLENSDGFISSLKKLLLIMKISTALLLFTFLQVSAGVYSQTTRVSLKMENVTIAQVLDRIESQTDFYFFYNRSEFNDKEIVSVDFADKKIDEILGEILADKSMTYEIAGKNIIIKESKIPSAEIVLQQKSIMGKVTTIFGEPIPGASVIVKGTTQGTISDTDGNYSLAGVAEDATLVFSFIGMRSQEIAVAGQTQVNVQLEEDMIGIEEVVAIGYGTQRRENVIGSVTAVREEELTSAPVGRISNALAGRLPGGIFMQESGEPGNDAATIRVRGNSSFGENQPLIVIDGIPGRDLNSLNPEDIESVTVLKDASAAIYGARAANGVILVITKGGGVDTPATFSYSFYEGFLSPSKLPELTDAPTYARMIREMQSYRNVDESNMRYSEEDIAKYESGEFPWTHPNTNWYEEALKNYSTTRHHNFSVTGGTQNVSYYGSIGSQFDDGIYTNSETSYKRYNVKLNIHAKINDYLTIGLDLSGIQENRMYPTNPTEDIFRSITRMYPTSHALFPGTNLPGPDIERGDQPMVSASSETGFDDDKRFRSNNLLSATFKIPWVDGLSLSGYYAYDNYMQRRKFFETPWTLYSLDVDAYLAAGNTGKEDGTAFLKAQQVGNPEPRLTNYSAYSVSKTANLKLDYAHTFKDVHNVEAFVAYEQSEYEDGGFDAFRRYFISDQLPYLFAGGDNEKDNSEYVGLDSRVNYFGRLSYNYQSTYFFQFSFRRDGSLRFSKESGRWGNFPSVLIGYRPSEQEWWKNKVGFIDDFKVRLSWGQMGNDQVAAFQYLTSYGFAQGYSYGENRDYIAALDQANVPNPNITWEVANVYNLGIDATFLDRKLSFESDFFYEKRTDILVQRDVSVPLFTGMTLPDENFGIVENRGLELLLTYHNKAGDFNYKVSGNFAFARNKVIEADEPEAPVPWQTKTGHPMNALLLYKDIGVFSDWDEVNAYPHVEGARPGDIIIEDYNDDKEINSLDRQLFTLTTTPEITFGFTFDLAYKNWSLRGLIQGQSRALREIYTEGDAGSNIMGLGGNYLQWNANDRWTPDHTDASTPRAFERTEEYWRDTYRTDYNFTDVSFARLKNLQLSYAIPQDLLEKVKVKNASVFVAGQNLWLIYSGNDIMDPETAGLMTYPIMKVVSVGAQITF